MLQELNSGTQGLTVQKFLFLSSLGSEKSGFTKVPSNAEKTRGDSRGQFTQSSYLN